MNALKSKTIKFNLFMALIESAHGGFALLEPVFTQETFIIVTFALGIIHAVGGVYLRFITTKSLNDL